MASRERRLDARLRSGVPMTALSLVVAVSSLCAIDPAGGRLRAAGASASLAEALAEAGGAKPPGNTSGRVRTSPDTFLRDIAGITGGSFVNLDSTEGLDETLLRLLDEFRQRYLVSYSPRGVAAGGWHRLEVRIKGRSAAVKARPGYLSGS